MVRFLSYLILTILFIASLLFSIVLLLSVITTYFSIPAMIVQFIIALFLILMVRRRRKKKKRVLLLWIPTVIHSFLFLAICILGLAFIFNLAEKEDGHKLKEAAIRIGSNVLKIDYFKKALLELEKFKNNDTSTKSKKTLDLNEKLEENTGVTFDVESNDSNSDNKNNSSNDKEEKKSNVEDPEGLK